MIFMRSLSIVVMSQIKVIPTHPWLVYFVLKAQPFFVNFALVQAQTRDEATPHQWGVTKRYLLVLKILNVRISEAPMLIYFIASLEAFPYSTL
jgi:hypothetical protein